MGSQYHVALFPFMSKGHTIPILHLARLLLRHRPTISITIFTTPANHPFISNFLLADTTKNVSIITLPFPKNINPDIPPGVESTDKLPTMDLFPLFALATKNMQQEFETAIGSLPPVNFMVSDGFLWWTLEASKKFGFPRLVFYGMNIYSSVVSKAVMQDRLLDEVESADEPINATKFPWINKVTKNDFPPAFANSVLQKGPYFDFYMKFITSASNSYGTIFNSFYDLEHTFADYYNKNEDLKSWIVGPLCLADDDDQSQKRVDPDDKKPSWIEWLDEKAEEGKSVLYVAFGSQDEIAKDQLKEILIGLDESKLNFLWVTRAKRSELRDIDDVGFEEKVRGRGILVREWVDQKEILMHKSVTGFLSHCGWNSALESICAGVPILAWPMMADQHMNARMVVEEIKVGLRVETSDGSVRGFVKWEGLEKMVKELMEGEMGKDVRKNVKEYTDLAKKAMEEGTGSSWKMLEMLIEELEIKS